MRRVLPPTTGIKDVRVRQLGRRGHIEVTVGLYDGRKERQTLCARASTPCVVTWHQRSAGKGGKDTASAGNVMFLSNGYTVTYEIPLEVAEETVAARLPAVPSWVPIVPTVLALAWIAYRLPALGWMLPLAGP